MLSQRCRQWTNIKSTLRQRTTPTILYRVCWAHAASYTLIDPSTVPDHVTSYDLWACTQTSHALPCGNAVGQCNAVRSHLYCWTSQHDANVVLKHQGIVKNVTGFPKASDGTYWSVRVKIKCHVVVMLSCFGGNPGSIKSSTKHPQNAGHVLWVRKSAQRRLSLISCRLL